ncbi:MAG: LysR family transcriptional regulator [Polyangiaceae bacterium]
MTNDFAGIEAFVHTAEQLSFRRAARMLGISTAAVSKAVAKLEERLGVQLLERTSRKVTLTPEGSAYLRHCQRALDALEAGHDAVQLSSRVAQGRLVVSVPYVLGPAVVRALPRLADRHPRLEVELRVTDRHVKLHDEGIDVAVRIGKLPDSDLVARRLASPRWVIAASPGYLAGHGVPLAPGDLSTHRCLKFLGPRGAVVEWQLAGEGAEVVVPTTHRFDRGELLVEAAVTGLGIVQAFDFLVEDHLRAGRLVEVLPAHAAPGPPVHVLCRRGRQRVPKVRVFLDLMLQSLGTGGA